MNHPAKYSLSILSALGDVAEDEYLRLGRGLRLLDPMAGVGKIHELACENLSTTGVELEPEWAALHPSTQVGDARHLPFDDAHFDIVMTSPCLSQEHRVLTNDLRWVPVGDVLEGDQLLAFDEYGRTATTGMAARRRWRRAVVLRSIPRRVECVRVILANGDEIVTTPEHPWLTSRYAYGGTRAIWVPSKDLAGIGGRHEKGARQAFFVQRQVEPWTERSSFDAGWLSGMFDGEGSLSLGVHGSPKMTLCQVEGPVIDRAEALMQQFGYEPNKIPRTGVADHRQKIANLYVRGGFPGPLRALGELRPTRLLSKWETLPIETRTVKAEKIEVLAVEPAGSHDIQEIETSEGTYFGEGYLHHNCYGNRMADHHDAKDRYPKGHAKEGQLTKRMTYKAALGRNPSEGSGATMQWGRAYRLLHTEILKEMIRVTKRDGLVVVNISNHIRGHKEQLVAEWWLGSMLALGLKFKEAVPIRTARMGYGKNREARVANEFIFVTRKP